MRVPGWIIDVYLSPVGATTAASGPDALRWPIHVGTVLDYKLTPPPTRFGYLTGY